MDSTVGGQVTSSAGLDRRVPTWASGLVAGLSRDLPTVVTREDLSDRLAKLDSDRDVDACIDALRRLGWLVGLPIQGTWAFIPPGQEAVADPYLPLRAWLARDPDTEFMLAGAAAAWHLGYLDRNPDGRTSVWLPTERRLPDGLRPHVSVVRVRWPRATAEQLGPSTALLLRRKLDLIAWASGLPAFGPEALVVQLSARPASFRPWTDLVAHLGQLAADCDDDRLSDLLDGQSASTWQRAAYLLHAAGHPPRGIKLFDRRPAAGPVPKVHFEQSTRRREDDALALWVPQYSVVDRLIVPLQGLVGKA